MIICRSRVLRGWSSSVNLSVLNMLLVSLILFANCVYAEVIERIVAVVDEEIILLSEFEEALRMAVEKGDEVNEGQIIDGMINNLLLLKQAGKFGVQEYGRASERMDSEKIIDKYLEKRIRALIYVPFKDIENYYYNNIEKYEGLELYDARKGIEKYLIERTYETRVQEHIDELRAKARIRIQLE